MNLQTSATNSRNPLVRMLNWLSEAHRSWYRDELVRQRHTIEHDARRLGGRVIWDDIQ